jgi:hypothetical protein
MLRCAFDAETVRDRPLGRFRSSVMHNAVVLAAFFLIILAPCFVAFSVSGTNPDGE